ncbi:MAG: succinylglutamate-semialdehyde dehydrogenase [Legionellales bacterium]|nr:succinylglutamate-semialdehyde dehydrogenase [Legionellales bacterium]
MLKEFSNLINGNWIQGSGKVIYSYDPSNNQQIWQGNMVDSNELELAISSSWYAFKNWSVLDISERVIILNKFKQELIANADELSNIVSIENGKPLWEAKTEVNSVINKIDISIKAYFDRCKQNKTDHDGFQSVISYKPVGVFAVLGPFNFPAHLPLGQIIPVILAGNCVIFKPSEFTPMVAIHFIRCLVNVGLPNGVINLIQGDANIGEKLVCSNTSGILFTGSYNTGKKIHQLNAGKPQKMLVLEMGGNNPLVLSKYKELNAAVDIVLISAFISSGQRCSCARKLILTEQIDQGHFIKLLINKINQIKIGRFDQDPEPFMGPLIHKQAVKNVIEHFNRLVELGADILVKGRLIDKESFMITPSLLDVSNINSLDQECFGPILQIKRVKDLNSAIEEANNTEYGLAASILTDEHEEFFEFRSRVNAGIINWNMPTTGALSSAPFGGVGKSGNYRPGGYLTADYCSYPFAGMYAVDKFKHEIPGI